MSDDKRCSNCSRSFENNSDGTGCGDRDCNAGWEGWKPLPNQPTDITGAIRDPKDLEVGVWYISVVGAARSGGLSEHTLVFKLHNYPKDGDRENYSRLKNGERWHVSFTIRGITPDGDGTWSDNYTIPLALHEEQEKMKEKSCTNCKHSSRNNNGTMCEDPCGHTSKGLYKWELYVPEPEVKEDGDSPCNDCKYSCRNTKSGRIECPEKSPMCTRGSMWYKFEPVEKEKPVERTCETCKYTRYKCRDTVGDCSLKLPKWQPKAPPHPFADKPGVITDPSQLVVGEKYTVWNKDGTKFLDFTAIHHPPFKLTDGNWYVHAKGDNHRADYRLCAIGIISNPETGEHNPDRYTTKYVEPKTYPTVTMTDSKGHKLEFMKDGRLKVGCEEHSVRDWIGNYATIAQSHGYNSMQRNELGKLIRTMASLLEDD